MPEVDSDRALQDPFHQRFDFGAPTEVDIFQIEQLLKTRLDVGEK